MCSLGLSQLNASSHREAPLIANDPLADNTDVYAFRSPDDPNTISILACYVPFQLPFGGPNYYQFGENIRYEIHIDNNVETPGDDIIYRFTFTRQNEDPTTFFNIRLGLENLKTTYTLERSTNGGESFDLVVENGTVPPYNIGARSIESPVGLGANSYEELFEAGILTTSEGEKVFCGPSDDPFFVDLGGIFDLGNSPRVDGEVRDNIKRLNVNSIALQIPIDMLQKSGLPVDSAANILDPDFVIGVWASASRPLIRTLNGDGTESVEGEWVQVSRLGMPLTNEAVIPIGDKDEWNARTPYNENPDHFEYFFNPELALYMDDDLFGGAVPAFAPLRIQRNSLQAFDFGNGQNGLFGLKGSDAVAGTALDDAVFGTLLLPDSAKPRSVDLWPIFHTGVPNVVPYQLATGKEGNPLAAGKPFINNFLPNGGDMLRLNMAVPVTDRDDPNFSSLGLVQAAVLGLTDTTFANTDLQFIPNMDGFPNGRRLEDDVTRIELQAVGGVVLAAIGLFYDDFNAGGTDPMATLFTSTNTGGNFGKLSLDGSDSGLMIFNTDSLDADGVYVDAANDRLFQVSRSNNRVDVYTGISGLMDGDNVTPAFSSTADFSNGREVAVSGDQLVVADDVDGANRFYVYVISDSSLILEDTIDVDINLWGIHAEGNDLYAIQDNSDTLAFYQDFFDATSGFLAPTQKTQIEGIVRTHGITYDAASDIMVLTDVGDGTVADDGGFHVLTDFSTKFSTAGDGGSIALDDQTRISGPNSLLGNPVDVAFNPIDSVIYIAERANSGGLILGFDFPMSTGDASPVVNLTYPGASAVYLDFAASMPNNPVTQDLLDVLTYSTGVEANDTTFRSTFPYVQLPWSGTNSQGLGPISTSVNDPIGLGLGAKDIFLSNFPNPFTGSTTLKYRVANSADVKVSIFDMQGKLIANLVDREHAEGIFEVQWNDNTVAPGVYIATIYSRKANVFQSIKLVKQ